MCNDNSKESMDDDDDDDDDDGAVIFLDGIIYHQR